MANQSVNAFEYLSSVGLSEIEVLAVIYRILPRVLECDVQTLREEAAELGLMWGPVAPFDPGATYRNKN